MTSSTFELGNTKNAAILRDFLIFWPWQREKRRNSARLPQFSKLAASKTKQFCEPSFKNGKLSAELTASYQSVLRFANNIYLEYCAYHEKWGQAIRIVLRLSRKIILENLKVWCSKIQPVSEISARTSQHLWRRCLLYWARHAKCIFADPLQMSHACQRFWNCYKTLTFCSLLARCRIHCACHAKPHPNF